MIKSTLLGLENSNLIPETPKLPIILRPSSVPMLWNCASSLLKPKSSGDSYPARCGTCLHKMAQDKIAGIEREIEWYSGIYGVDEADLYWPAKNWIRIWDEIKQYFPNPIVEQKVTERKQSNVTDNVIAEGTPDIVDISQPIHRVNDWKFGHLKNDAYLQGASYAWLCGKTYGLPPSGKYEVFISWVTRNEVEKFEFTVEQLKEFRAVLNKQVEAIGKSFNPGDFCSYCGYCNDCEARLNWLRQTGAALHSEMLSLTTKEPSAITPHDLVKIYPRVKQLEKLIESYKKAVRLAVESSPGGVFDLAEGGLILSLDEVEEKTFDFKKTLPLLKEIGLSSEEINSLTTLGKTALEKIIRSKAERGQKEETVRLFYNKAREAECYTVTSYKKLKLEEKK